MNYTHASGLQCIYSSKWPGESPLSGSNQVVITKPVSLATVSSMAVQVVSDGGAALNFKFQVTNFPQSFAGSGYNIFGNTVRDDSAGSMFWETTPSGTGSIPQTPSSETLVLNPATFWYARLVFTQTAGTGNIFACCCCSE